MKRSLRALAVLLLLSMTFALLPVLNAGAAGIEEYYDIDIRSDINLQAARMTVTKNNTKMQDANGEVIATLKKGEVVYHMFIANKFVHDDGVVDGDGEFYYVVRHQKSSKGHLGGFVPVNAVQFDSLEKIIEGKGTTKGALFGLFKAEVTGDYVNVRAGYAGTPEHEEIVNFGRTLRKGDKVLAYQLKNNWYKIIKLKEGITGIKVDYFGWVYGDFIDYTGPSPWRNRSVSGIPSSKGKVTSGKLGLYETFQAEIKTDNAPLKTESGAITGYYAKGTIVTVLVYGKLHNTYYVVVNGVGGYMDSKYLKKLD